jgi:hypothetical protein
MPEYIFTAKSPQGQTVTETIHGPSADEVVLTLHDRGYSEIQLHTDDVSAIYTDTSATPNLSPAEVLHFRSRSGRLAGFLFVTRKVYAEGWKMHLFFLAIVMVRRVLQFPWGWIDYPLPHR